ncbi:ATP-binding protein [Szabonella alba]|uniref:ATP-binding protein n=1 Tax=Szabonella alba TaxID=2804194 RepID=A0A8K0V7P2_9RHOB|nr:ATP-binding protein [Szabonella alba]MBL4916661.1 ATP-binding protein [Szabonella alba]
MTLTSDPASVRAALERLFSHPPFSDLDADLRGTAEIVMAEILNNIVEHAYAGEGGRIEMALQDGEGGLHCSISDRGRPFPLGEPPAGGLPDLSDDLPEGGFGWALIRAYAEDLNYERRDGWNHLRFRIGPGLPA